MAETSSPTKARPRGRPRQKVMVFGLLAAPGLAHELAEDLARDLPRHLEKRRPGSRWKVEVELERRAGAAEGAGDKDLVQITRRRMLKRGWELAVCLTDLPLRIGRRPATAHASVSMGVGLVSVPALGAVDLEARVEEAVLRLVDRLLGLRKGGRRRQRRRAERLRRGLASSPVGQAEVYDDRVRYVSAGVRGNLRLVVGMVRANRPWRLVAGLSKALVSALGTGAIALASTGVWHLAAGMGWQRLLGLMIASLWITGAILIAIHGLWEHSRGEHERERVRLFNVATTLTIALGVATLYLALLLVTLLCALAVIPSDVLSSELRQSVAFDEYLKLAWLVTTLATLGGGLGSAVETRQAVREAAYGYEPDHDEEQDT